MRTKYIIKFDDNVNIVSYIWKEEDVKLKGVIQIAHGMAEHILRYDEFASYLAEKGFIVIGHDHYAHGESAESIEKIGEVLDYDFMDAIIKGMKLVKDYFKDDYSNLPSYLFAHSMGSMAAQRYIQLYPNDFSKVILSGTDIGGGKYIAAKLLTSIINKKGKIKYSNFVQNISMGSFNKKFKTEDPDYGWLSTNADNYKLYREDPYCGKAFPVNYFLSLSKMLNETVKKPNLEKVNTNIQIFIYSGAQDPVSGYGKAIQKLGKLYSKYNINVKTKIYMNARHEVHNEVESVKVELMNDIVTFYEN